MINTILNISKEEIRIEITGHANYSKAGNDIVCAGVSSLAQALALSFEKEKRKGFHKYIDDGAMTIRIAASDSKEETNTAMAEILLVTNFIDALSEQYPYNVAKTVVKTE